MFFQRGFKVLGATIIPTLIFAQTAMAFPTTVFFAVDTDKVVSADYEAAVEADATGNHTMLTALKAALNTATVSGKSIIIQDDAGKVIDYSAAQNAHVTYGNALSDPTFNSAAAPTPTGIMNSSGVVIPVGPQTGDGTVSSVNAINGTTVEVTFADAVTAVAATDFTFTPALAVTNAVIKGGSDNKVVTVTTATQAAGQSYNVLYKLVDTGKTIMGPVTGITANNPAIAVVGQQQTLTSQVTPAVAGVEVTFAIASGTVSELFPDMTLKATTNASGVATVTYTRNNPITDAIAAYPTNNQAIRANSRVWWGVNSMLSVTPIETRTITNASTQTYSVTVRSQTSGAPVAGAVVNLTYAENNDTSYTNDVPFAGGTVNASIIDGTTFAESPAGGVSAEVNTNPSAPLANRNIYTVTTDANGVATFSIRGNNTTVTPIVWVTDNALGGAYVLDTSRTIDATEVRLPVGALTFAPANTPITLTDITQPAATTAAINGQKIYSINALQANGQPFVGNLRVGFTENVDDNLTTTTTAVIPWIDNRAVSADQRKTAIPAAGGAQLIGAGADDIGAIPTAGATANTVGGVFQNTAVITTNSDGKATFGVQATAATNYTPIVWSDLNANAVPDASEPKFTGTLTSFIASEMSGSTFVNREATTKNYSTVSAAAAGNDLDTGFTGGVINNPAVAGENTYRFQLVNQSGVAQATAGVTVEYTYENLGTKSYWITNENLGAAPGANLGVVVAAGQTVTRSVQTDAAGLVDITVDAEEATKAKITAKALGQSVTTQKSVELNWATNGPAEPDFATLGTLATVGAANGNLTWTAVNANEGADVTVALVDPGANNAALGVVVAGRVITVNLATGVGGAITSIASDISAAILASAPASALVTTANTAGSNGTGLVLAVPATAVATGLGADAVTYSASGTVVAVNKGTIGDGIGVYTIVSNAGELITINFASTDVKQIGGSAATALTFETALTVGDLVSFTNDTTGASTQDIVNITTNN